MANDETRAAERLRLIYAWDERVGTPAYRNSLMTFYETEFIDDAFDLLAEDEKTVARAYLAQRAELDRLRAEVAAAREADAGVVNLDDFAGHTPGPWKVERRWSNECEIVPRITCERDADRGCGWIADAIGAPYLGHQSTLPNARLIAAAPDLLAEVRRLRAENAELVAAIRKYSVYAQARGSAPFGATAEEQAALARHEASAPATAEGEGQA